MSAVASRTLQCQMAAQTRKIKSLMYFSVCSGGFRIETEKEDFGPPVAVTAS